MGRTDPGERINPRRIDCYPTGTNAKSQSANLNCRNISISNNVGGVKHFSSTRRHALEEERHFALVEAFAFALPTKARSQSVSVRNSVRPIHLFDHNCDHDYYFELPCEGERDAQSLRR